MLRVSWQMHDVECKDDLRTLYTLWKQSSMIAAAFDTETDGLHIIHAVPFLFQFGWVNQDMTGHTFAVDLEQQPKLARAVIKWWNEVVRKAPVYLAHNIKFDLHMLINIGLPYTGENVSDTLFYIRYGHDALTPAHGGPPLKLKDYAAQYITGTAKSHEKLLNAEKSSIAKSINNKLRERLANCGAPPAKYNARSYTLAVINDMFKDAVFSATDLPTLARDAYYDWLNLDVPIWLQDNVHGLVEADNIPYNHLNRKYVKRYAHYDIVWVLEIFLFLDPIIKARKNEVGLQIENQLIYPLLDMERVGFDADVPYLQASEQRVAAYIKERRIRLYKLAGEEIKISQAKRIIQIFKKRYNVNLESSEKETLQILRSDCIRAHTNEQVVEFIDVINELRTLEKWYSTYILRFLKDVKHEHRLYTTIHQVGTVSGRVTSDFQQFPKKAIKTKDGLELFHPRKLIKTNTGMVFLDYSQIELRFQALYTILVGHPDLNLCRAYMPYQCFRKTTSGECIPFNYAKPEDIRTAYTETWYLQEAPNTVWTPTDVHGATTKAAFGIDESDPQFHDLRYIGKRVNFAKNYGAQYGKICTMFPERTAEECRRIDAAYYTAFPGVKSYHAYCYDRSIYAYTVNLFGVKYYGVSGHKLINMLVQGSAAFYLKKKIIALYHYRKEHNIKTKWQMQIHDELSWEWNPEDDPKCFFEFKHIMEDWPDGYVPLIADMEVTTSTWADKIEVDNIDKLQQALYPSLRSIG